MHGSQNRLRLLSLVVLLFAILLTSRLYMVQIVSGENFEARAENQYVAGVNYFDRGSIFFTTKDGTLVPGASIKTGLILHINPIVLRERGDLESVYKSINAITPVNKEDFLAKAAKKDDPYEELVKHLPTSLESKIRALKIPGLSVSKERWRVYPGEKMAAHAVGLIGYSGDTLAGRYGLERYYETLLERDKDNIFINFFAEIFSNVKEVIGEDENLEGDVVTTIEPSVEAFLESELDRVTAKYSSDFTGGIVINPRTGEIFGMALTPTFDPNFPQKEKNSIVFSNRLVEDRYEMGSIVKALTLAVGLDSKAITARSTFNDPGCMTLNTRTFCNYDGESHGSSVSMQTVLNKSLNTGAAYVALRMGNAKFNNAMLAFRHERFGNYRTNLATTLGLGILFILLQGWGWRQLVLAGVGLEGNPAGGFIYIISGIHLLHILVGLIFLGIVLGEALLRRPYIDSFVYSVNPPNRLKIKLITLYWHFVDILWIGLFLFLLVHHGMNWRLSL